MHHSLAVIRRHLARSTVLATMVSLPILMLYADIHWLHDMVGEWSLVEVSQELFLFASALAFVRLARRNPRDRGFAVLATGMLACMLIRELDAVWDLVFHGLWQLMVSMIAVSCLVYAAQDQRRTLDALARFLVSRSGMPMTVGLVLLLCYSRLLGMTSLWRGLLGAEYVRIFKNAVEETTELLGYTFILSSSLAYVRQQIRTPRSSSCD